MSAASIPPHTTAAAAELKVMKENTLKFNDKQHPKQQWTNALTLKKIILRRDTICYTFSQNKCRNTLSSK